MLARTGCFDGRVEGKQIGLVSDVVDDADALGDFLHRHDGLLHRFAAVSRFLGSLAGHAIGDFGVLGVLVDAGAHLLDRRAGLFDAGRLFAGSLAH